AADAKLKETRKQQAQVEAQLELQRRTLASQLRAEYMLGGRSHLHVLLSTSDPGLGGRLLADYGYVAQARGDAIATVQGQIQKLADLEARVQSQHKSLAALEGKRKQALVDLQAEQKHRKKAVAALTARVEDKSAELDALRASEKRLKRLLVSIRKQLAEVPKQDQYISGKAFGHQRGHLVWPARGKLLARYGALRAGGPLTWKGLWIAAPQGAPVHAAADGRAVYIGWVSSYGLIILLQHGHGYYTLYGHVASAVVKLGQDVKAGQVIGKAGDTGGYPDSGVYFEIRHDNKALDPGKWLAH
ncbi:MAG: peptidoglycan DD-metalloendopeptidase family protein, partial [Sinobacteraceae bacterium]|nr:peptidoglycan DD-metalloendopeptidase family protein [Nevskiaceae bacterium]